MSETFNARVRAEMLAMRRRFLLSVANKGGPANLDEAIGLCNLASKFRAQFSPPPPEPCSHPNAHIHFSEGVVRCASCKADITSLITMP